MIPDPWRLLSDQQRIGGRWRNLVVLGPWILTDQRKYWLAFDTERDRFKETDCLTYLRRQDKTLTRKLGEYVRSTQPDFY